MTKKIFQIFLILTGVIFFSILVITKLIENSFEKDSGKNVVPALTSRETSPSQVNPAAAPAVNPQTKRVLTPEKDPGKYGITIRSPLDIPRDQEEWDKHMERTFEEKWLKSPQALEMFKKIKMNPEKFSVMINEFDQDIRRLEEKSKSQPQDEKTQNELKNLRALKAMTLILEKKKLTSPQ